MFGKNGNSKIVNEKKKFRNSFNFFSDHNLLNLFIKKNFPSKEFYII